MNLEVKIEIRSIVKKITNQLADGDTHNFTVFVQGLNGNQIEHFVQKVVFHLPFNSLKQVKNEPPYLITGSAHASFRLPIDIFLLTSEARNTVRYSYYVYLPNKPIENAVNVKTLTFRNAPQDFRERLLLGGAEMVKEATSEAVTTLVKSEPVEIAENQDTDTQNEIGNEMPDICAQSNTISKPNDSFLIQGIYSFNELMKENEILKKENENLFDKFNKQEGVIATYVEKLPALQNDFSACSTELGELQKRAEVNEAEISSLKSTIQTLKSEIVQYNNKLNEARGQTKRRKKSAVSSSSSVSEGFLKERNVEDPNITGISQGVNPSEKEPCENIFAQATRKRAKSAPRVSRKRRKTIEKTVPEDIENEPQMSSLDGRDIEPGFLKPQEEHSMVCDYQNLGEDLQIIFESVSESAAQKGIEREPQDSSLQVKVAERSILKPKRTDRAVHDIDKLPTQCDSLGISEEVDPTLSPIPADIAPENDNTSNYVDRNFTAETGVNQSVSTCISANAKFQRRPKIKCLRRRRKEVIPPSSIRFVVRNLKEREISEAKHNYYVNSLTDFLTNPENCPNISALIFLVIDHLRDTDRNYLHAFRENRARCIFLPSSESCIVSALFEIEKLENYSQSKLTQNVLNTIHHLILATKAPQMFGFASLCRVYAEICKRKNDSAKCLSFCVELLKARLQSAPYFIASIVGVWREPFTMSTDQSEEAMILLGSISLGAGTKMKKGHDNTWLCTSALISEYFGFPSLPERNIALNFLKDKIISNCAQNSHEKSWMLTSSFVILASFEPWEWTEKHLIKEYIIPNLSRYAIKEPNENAFALFCDLCVDVHNLRHKYPHSVLMKYFKEEPKEGGHFVKEWAAVSLIKFTILNKSKIKRQLRNWIEKNLENLENFKELYLRKEMYYCKGIITDKDIVIT
ncbi:unnamed protein product [Larinioides sclopetarius]|uniref:YEATS domain-containing protein n=1 Tax=Larinioides sclopetarius TaxID=280406 RepID=A0AAV2B560_9ARAC